MIVGGANEREWADVGFYKPGLPFFYGFASYSTETIFSTS